MTIADVTERALIARLRARVPAPRPDVLLGIGDDAAVVAPARGMVDVITTDALVEDIHFRRDWASPRDIGEKAVAVNLSDLAAMGAAPRAILLSLILPAAMTVDDFDALIDGALSAATHARASLIGGNLSRSPGPLVVDVTAMGVVRPRRVLRRSGARPGDRLFVTGALGASAAGLASLSAGRDDVPDCVAAHLRPQPRLRTGVIVARTRAASACMDLSDGLADAVRQICDASACGAEIAGGAIPRHPRATEAQALTGGEDYELLFAVPNRRVRQFQAAVRQAGEAPITEIGTCTKTLDIVLIDGATKTSLPEGFQHF